MNIINGLSLCRIPLFTVLNIVNNIVNNLVFNFQNSIVNNFIYNCTINNENNIDYIISLRLFLSGTSMPVSMAPFFFSYLAIPCDIMYSIRSRMVTLSLVAIALTLATRLLSQMKAKQNCFKKRAGVRNVKTAKVKYSQGACD